jgi:hypothetical protein
MRRKRLKPAKVLICRCYPSSTQVQRELTLALKNTSSQCPAIETHDRYEPSKPLLQTFTN